ncbi:hypothetical protein KHA80_10660 [Anaerobacillus sp. HL2]|nr:hypothetical protein KHA80_10660 [Anaerobacillus sp. HL2]
MRESVKSAEAMLVAIGQEPSEQIIQLMDFVDRLLYLSPSLIIATELFMHYSFNLFLLLY